MRIKIGTTIKLSAEAIAKILLTVKAQLVNSSDLNFPFMLKTTEKQRHK